MNWTMFGDLHESQPLALSKIANQRNLGLNLVERSYLCIARRTIFSIDSGMAQAHLHIPKRPLLSVRVHPNRHASASTQCCQKQFIRIWSTITTPIGKLVCLQTVLPDLYRLQKTFAIRIYDDNSRHISSHQRTCASDDARSNSPLVPDAPRIAHA